MFWGFGVAAKSSFERVRLPVWINDVGCLRQCAGVFAIAMNGLLKGSG